MFCAYLRARKASDLLLKKVKFQASKSCEGLNGVNTLALALLESRSVAIQLVSGTEAKNKENTFENKKN